MKTGKPAFWKLVGVLLLLLTLAFLPACSDDDGNEDVDGDTESPDGDTEVPDGDGEMDGDMEAIDGDAETDGDAEEEADYIEAHTEKMNGFTVVWLHGTPYEMGYQQGELLYDTIKEAIEFVEADNQLRMLASLAEGLGLVEMAEANSYPSLLQECQGLVDAAEGTGLTMTYCLILNFGDVMLENIPSFKRREVDGPGCTSLIVSGDATADGRLYHARNLDWSGMDISIIHANPVIFVRQPSGGVPHVYVGFPLNLSPYTSMNAAGITGVSHEADPVDDTEKNETGRSHAQMLGEIIASAESMADVRAFLAGEPHMSSEMLVFADGETGEGSVFEMTGKHMAERTLTDGYVFTSNHFEDPGMVDYDLPQSQDYPDSSLMRWERLSQLIPPNGQDSLYGDLDPAKVIAVMRDRVNPRTGVSAPWNEANVDNNAGIGTNGPMHMVLFDPAKLLFWVAAGTVPIPAQPYKCFSLGDLLGMENASACEPAEFPNPDAPEERR